MPPPSLSTSTSSSSSSSPLSDWASRVAPALARLRDACSQTSGPDPEIDALTRVLEDAFRAEEAVLREVAAAASPPDDDAALERLLAPVAFAQNGVEIQPAEQEDFRLMPAAFGAAQIGVAKRLAKAVAHRIADNDCNSGHA